ncbi:unnamed protein product [Dovyalis caffra]|uniref:Gnk2-homologous domain-containing protein n=1 Tax=Dovyalis caffra TaxID=77055 RepID=A0AAV1RTZ3_9ROSI|nr:unnamed protein product [Dovyalis caffra]
MARTTSSSLLLTFTFLISLSSLPSPSLSASTDAFVFGGCTQQKYGQDTPFESNLNSLLTSLVNSATYSSYNNYTILGSSPQDVVYGLYQCRGDLSMPDCATCVARAVSQLGVLCAQTCGGALQLQGCYVKYDNTTFLGVEDKTVVLKKCGPSVGYDTDAMNLRDSVLGSLTSTGGPYRVGGSGDVQGVAQCVGDLSAGQCQDCLSEAIVKLKSDCGTADYGDMFLAKCYASYTTGGPHVYSKGHSDFSQKDELRFINSSTIADKYSNDGEKTFAIIVGLLAGVAIVIIFLAFLRRVFGGNGKIPTFLLPQFHIWLSSSFVLWIKDNIT